MGRRVERSPLGFARDRWVLSPAPKNLDIAPKPRRRADFSAWVDERAGVPIDPEHGPSWHLGVLPLEDGGCVVSLVASHVVIDGVGMCLAIADAVEGRTRNLGYRPAGSRTLGRALIEDGWQTLAATPELTRAAVAGVRWAWRNRADLFTSNVATPISSRAAAGDHAVSVPTLIAYLDAEEWDDCARRLGGTSNSLLAGLASRLAVRVGRVSDDETVTLWIPVNERAPDDARGNAWTRAIVKVNATGAARDLSEIRVKIKQALIDQTPSSNEWFALLPLTSMTPKWLYRRLVTMWSSVTDLPIDCSNSGQLDTAVNRPDGTEADYLSVQPIEPGIKKSRLEHMGGQLFLGSMRIHGKICISITAYLVGRRNSKDELRELISRTFAEFNLTAAID
ncbi:hypothetical protein H7I94_27885 [Mycobacterium szulgai]|nr:hypothetical protein [Mycobacterium szulgai]